MRFRSISLSDSKEWCLQDGAIKHRTNGFFSVVGVVPQVADEGFNCSPQPIILQTEIGILGFIISETENGFDWLVQAKPEPGNKDGVQLAPTVQATYSNYMCKHGGTKTHYLSYFQGSQNTVALSDCLQSEQGTRFLGKFNRNSVQQVDGRTPLKDDKFAWFESREIRRALLSDYTVNTDARSVIVTSPWKLVATDKAPFSSGSEAGSFQALCRHSYCTPDGGDILVKADALLEAARERFGLTVNQCALEDVAGWKIDETGIENVSGDAALDVKFYAVETSDREVSAWDQPFVGSRYEGEVALFAQKKGGFLSFYLKLCREVGLTSGVELGPSYQSESNAYGMRSMRAVLESPDAVSVLTAMQSDEGGRFMVSLVRYSIVLLPETAQLPDEDDGLWVTLSQLERLCRAPKVLTNEARSCVSLLLGLA